MRKQSSQKRNNYFIETRNEGREREKRKPNQTFYICCFLSFLLPSNLFLEPFWGLLRQSRSRNRTFLLFLFSFLGVLRQMWKCESLKSPGESGRDFRDRQENRTRREWKVACCSDSIGEKGERERETETETECV